MAEVAKKRKNKKKDKKLCYVKCEWDNCETDAWLVATDFELFSAHLREHADYFVNCLENEAVNQVEGGATSCCCMWRLCSWEGCEDFTELKRHIMYHGYHALLKSLGQIVQTELQISPCRIEYPQPLFSFVNTPFVCCWYNCSEEFICPDKFYRHVQLHVMQANLDLAVKSDRIVCLWVTGNEVCEQDFCNKHKLKEHVRVHTHEKLLACPGCGRMFSNRTKFLDHLSRQVEEAYENYQCSHCLKRYPSERLLRDHMRHHVNCLKCPHCNMTSPNAGALRYHIHYRHTDHRPFPCGVCKLKFKSAIDLNRHEEIHLPEIYTCNFQDCNFSTKTSRSLLSHINVRHSDKAMRKPYVCHICNRAYSRGFSLTKHLKKKHSYCWPAGHPRFRYIEHDDGLYRLQMVRFHTVELTEKLQKTGLSKISTVTAAEIDSNEERDEMEGDDPNASLNSSQISVSSVSY